MNCELNILTSALHWSVRNMCNPAGSPKVIKQEGHDGPGSLTLVSFKPRTFKLSDFGVK